MSDMDVIEELLAATTAKKLEWILTGDEVTSSVANIGFSLRLNDADEVALKVSAKGTGQGVDQRVVTLRGGSASDLRILFDTAVESATSQDKFLAEVHGVLVDAFRRHP
ncbi:hypothetical protein G5C51_32335 [Streptomyces sp. A7024]|uniref:Uncharacterized protein n=1 Tax=Streptomyces coryli TaxID=1128680 RepID=A0A6G4U988_9ACTN|nr:hypothetical protein [Streptomyces coryli]NGN68572.1 hypothetical protein [Streptomyces coryli]